jgi:hypothetical protein
MHLITRRAVVGIGFALALALLSGCTPRGTADDKPLGVSKDEVAVTIKDVIIDHVDEPTGTISVSFGKKSDPTKLLNVPLAQEVRVVASHVLPGSVNHLPFRWEYVRRLQGRTVSVRLQVASTGLSVTSISSGND